MSRGIFQAFVAGLVGFGLGCALINAAGRRSAARVRPSTEMAYVPPAQASQSTVMLPTTIAALGRRELVTSAVLAAGTTARRAIAEEAALAKPKKKKARPGP